MEGVPAFLDLDPARREIVDREGPGQAACQFLDEGALADAAVVAAACREPFEACVLGVAVIGALGLHFESDRERMLLDLLQHYVREPTERDRRLALGAAEVLEYTSAVALVAGAVGLLGSIAPAGSDNEVRVDDWVVNQMVLGALLRLMDDGKVSEHFESALREALVAR